MKRLLLLCALLCWPVCAAAVAPDVRTDDFGRIPVLSEGRVKPLDSLARVMLKRIHNRSHYDDLSASAWLAFCLFQPADAMRLPQFYVTRPVAAQMLGLPADTGAFYSFEALASALPAHGALIQALGAKEKNDLTEDEAEVMRLYAAANDFAELIDSFSLLLPLAGVDDATRATLALPDAAPVTLLDVLKNRHELTQAAKRSKPAARLLERLAVQEAADGDNALLRVIPPSWQGSEWLSPWAVIKTSSGSPQSARLFAEWKLLAMSYRAHDATGWNETARALLHDTRAAAGVPSVAGLDAEYLYNRLDPLSFAAWLYGCGIALLAIAVCGLFAGARRPGITVLACGLACHAAALCLRMIILGRPPVSTLYESLLFVSFVVMAFALWLGARRANMAALLLGAPMALALLLASRVFAGDGDTLGVLVAVLNTNFWLATHVICITTGYGCSLMTGAVAHLYLFRRALRDEGEAKLAPLAALLTQVALLALFFTAIGTMLGGIWADQSWGRFWGWDPKENGALLIVLWLIWILHGRLAGQLGAVAFAACAAFITVIVGLAWIGVNLLGVGLHSYGFTHEAAAGLATFCAAEMAFIALAVAVIQRLRKGSSRA